MIEVKELSEICPISEEHYAEAMANVVEPALASVRREGFMTFLGGRKIHYEYHICPEAKASIVLLHGFTESAEKFREMVYYFLQCGYNVFAPDHRGHGFSSREVKNPSISHINHFSDYVGDTNAFIENVVKPHFEDLPLYLYAHSMGGAIAVLYLQQFPDVFEKAVLSSPMIAPKTAGYPMWMTKAVASFFAKFGKKEEMVFTEHTFDPNVTFESSSDTSEARHNYYFEKKKKTIEYQNCAASYGWLNESLRIIPKMLDVENCQKIRAKILLCQPQRDDTVEMSAQEEFASKVVGATILKFPASNHEIYMSVNSCMQPYIQTILTFLEEEYYERKNNC